MAGSSSASRTPKLDPSLVQELAEAEATGATKPIPVLIELATPVRASRGSRREQAMQSMEQQSRRLQQKLVARLVDLRARHIHQATIVNAVSAELGPAQIRLIAARPDVRIIRLARPEQVTTA